MEWQNTSSAQGWYPQNYTNMAYGTAYNQPPPAIGSATQYWSHYAGYSNYPQTQWGYPPIPPNYSVPPPTFQVPPTNNAESQPPINPPLPRDPPPDAPPIDSTETVEIVKPAEKSKEVPPVAASTQNNFSVAENYNYQYPLYNNTASNWFEGNQQAIKATTKDNNQFNKSTPIKFNLNSKSNLGGVNTEKSKLIDNVTSSTSSAIIGKTNNIKGKFNQMNFMKSENLSIDNNTIGNCKKSVEIPKQSLNMMQQGEWPESLKTYVSKCFNRCLTEFDKDQVEICLKGKLTQSMHNQSIWDKDWDKESLINVYSHPTDSPGKEGNLKQKFDSSYEDSDLSRGFILRKKTSPKSLSYDGFVRPEKRSSPEADFLPLSKRSKVGKKRGKKWKNMNNAENQNNPFYSKMGAKNNFVAENEFGSSEMLQKRAARFAPTDMPQVKKSFKQNNRLGPRKKMNLMAAINVTFASEENIDWGSMHIIGTCTIPEKQFLRLTAAPDPSTVRTPVTLKCALDSVKKKWTDTHDYRSACDQLKSIRQDLTVQGIRNKFTVKVYETHCRIALEKGDHEEFNQCQSQLKQLYSEIGGNNVLEFTAYRLLYYIFTTNTLDITSLIAGLSDRDKANETVAFALEVRAAWSFRNYYRFFSLYRKAPLMSGFLMDWFSERERKNAIKVIIKGYRPGAVNVDFVRSCLAFDSDDDWNKCVELCSLKFTDASKELIDCKATVLTI